MTSSRFHRLILALAAGVAVVALADSMVGPRRLAVNVAAPERSPEPVSPLAGTPAEAFPAGAAGIVLPDARAIPDRYVASYEPTLRDITTAEVAEALERVRAAMIAARLDEAMLIDHDLEPFIRTLAPVYWEHWDRPRSRPWPSWRWWYESPGLANHATMLDPDAAMAAPPRVTGEIVYRAGTDQWGRAAHHDPIWVLEVVTRFVWVYAFEVAAGEPGDGIVVVRDEAVWVVPTDYRARFGWLDVDPNEGIHRREAQARAWGADCDLYGAEGWLRPGKPGRIPEAVFDVAQPLAALGGCEPGE